MVQQFCDCKDIVGTELLNILQQLLHAHIVELGQVQVVCADLQRADTLQQSLLQICADAHNLTGCLHLGAQNVGSGGELIEGKTGQLSDHIVKLRLESCVGIGDLDLIQGHTHSDLSGDAGNGIAGRLGGQSRRPGNAGVNLDEVVLRRIGVQRELHITAAGDLQFLDQLDSRIVEHLQIVVVQGHNGRNNQAVAGVDANGVDIFHTTDGDGIVFTVTHNLELDLLIALDRLLDQYLMHRRKLKCIEANLDQFFLIVSKAATGTAQGEGRTQNNGITDTLGSFLSFLNGVSDLRRNNRLADGLAQFLEHFTVLSALDGCAGSTQQFHTALLQNTLLLQLHNQVQTGLTTNAGQNGIGTLVANNLSHILQSQRLHIDLVRNGCVGHNGSGVGVAQHNFVSLFLQGKACLGTGIVKLSGLADDNRAGADDQNLL